MILNRNRPLAALLLVLVFLIGHASPSFARTADSTLRDHLHLAELEGEGWVPDAQQKLKGIIVCTHGFALNANSYANYAERVSKEGFAVFALDARGFGKWRVKNKDAKLDLNLTVSDTMKLLEYLKKEFPRVPIFLLGESMGGAVALTTAAKYEGRLDGVIASVPAARRFDQKKSIFTVGARLLFAPDKEFDVSRNLVSKALSCEQLQEKWISDPQNRLHLSAKELLQFQTFMNNATKLSANITRAPVLIIQGCGDTLVRPDATIKLYNSIADKDKQLLLVGEAEHLIFQKGLMSRLTFDMVLAWLRNHAEVK